MASENVKEFTDQNFETDVLKSDVPVLVDFWADWCPPCVKLAPTIDKLAADYEGRVKVGKVNTDANQTVSFKYGISAIPTVILFRNGEVVQKFVGFNGAKQERDFREALDAATK
jgi:thioredoxin 1